jgi:AcrR family transcriptional regulator
MADGATGRAGPGPRRRADARRNAETLLDAARSVFEVSGVDAPAKEITDLAGVGVGTLYRISRGVRT